MNIDSSEDNFCECSLTIFRILVIILLYHVVCIFEKKQRISGYLIILTGQTENTDNSVPNQSAVVTLIIPLSLIYYKLL